MLVSEFDYVLPPELIAMHPAPERTGSRMLVVSRESGTCEPRAFPDIVDYLEAGDCLVVNNTKVIPARLFGRRQPTGGRVEAFLLERLDSHRWSALLRPGRRLRSGAVVEIEAAPGQAFVVEGKRPDGVAEIRFETADVFELLEQAGSIPLPPYIKRPPVPEDDERYQTVYAEKRGAVAAPTAGLHFSQHVLDAMRAKGVKVVSVTLHVGAGTFKPVAVPEIKDHVMHEEVFELTEEAADSINATRVAGGRVIAVGTTSVRVLETCAVPADRTVQAQTGKTRIFLHPPKRPQVTDGLLTNFHLPKSTLLMLVSTFATVADILAAYQLAVKQRFRFYSYGDCMLLI
ncbi:MAG: tRNA preQ1(34) S-adenosylmethionine ribosyltransferase-isomerase QueA [Lentisphaerae bacterium]|jgi:S-adenosylmethionine:tRNA ribosyltransferase-isomerase|nr:tRNA preQ1(34) S-adenosylmethionine ribosyltransferase-isomerase QueA [Lentisphaerota bacterium]MBT5609750.1 tRNA preQ1(34) S-adenosylmethionine ribosyltransferase-isomerase QueA [Lentisphaerota bacterium]MBT7061392.1 tRNA preQ1(34) S-adenosylmethionine ribosyltransferase-isomerase QueA [Lentisphaerota bacterium]MBT7845082.1 tRNA preQ1(34) S-adenosylmethionine ribosyltransferase-isomerase QueA [Lentisphaerota bacterium]